MSHNAADIEEFDPTDDPSGDDSFTGYPASIPYLAFKYMVVRG